MNSEQTTISSGTASPSTHDAGPGPSNGDLSHFSAGAAIEAGRLLAGRRVLVADDNPVNLHLAVHMLNTLGYSADAAGDGMQAVEMHAATPYDVILLDCDMPRLDGYEATRRIRALAGAAGRTPVIALTAGTSAEERRTAELAAMNDFLSKPLRPQVLADMLSRWMPQFPVAEKETDTGQVVTGDRDELEAIKEMFGKDFSELCSLYTNDSPPRIAAMRKARAEGNLALLAKVAHALGGSSASIGANYLSALCSELEIRIKNDELGDVDVRLAAIEDEYRRISDKLQALLN